ncbi:MAG: hypothetical protein A2268_13725 [Candidatus Raymondbacteria bacterium RifOxyA12_full_50_37]|uniref:Uncharacterized protein n=1 Tax=Candidatus Raymondbacteria bacterium RIFOXYD12_FULL_49_13 TaxID=1817890 RepID=A0A1F7FLL7_UNCRA|nr:MAG: hypothetical protein A2248_08120 [Candidatus Raymondbacteria bacterium RIFOXYA2_FULL_49_16]OGJ87204.1 MAG: hypothetical protein A2350_04370 [Candidatus Raymondbacteria bacterium RifOxyB12_full_50_8]OGJ91669.1 MAG: hypothetical protein A2268_13725 [Candidatus Raymondbacteria bacterium RifOxyA12_full_50_37]OGJ95220.1 MAG: hypothetical protein A2453_12130 [Candidatus Raymondbacteria bacterium RIFOXYC2_FULL_50_21]OGK05998.1 MAG: hypothetical protein A2487_14445 [Candidatus Raymondbacteria b
MIQKNPYLLPGIALAVLVVLFVFQSKQQKKGPVAAKAQEVRRMVCVMDNDGDSLVWKGTFFPCGADKSARAGALIPGPFSEGAFEFDIFSLGAHPGMLAGLCDTANDPCANGGTLFAIAATDQGTTLSLSAQGVSIKTPLAPITVPVRVVCEWRGKEAVLYINGIREGTLALSRPLEETDALFFCALPDTGSGQTGPVVRSLKLFLNR